MLVRYNPSNVVPPQYRGALNTAIAAGQTMSAIGNSRWFRSLSKGAKSAVKAAYKSYYATNPSPQGPLELAPVALNRRIRNSRPKFKGQMDGTNVITHREYIGDVAGNTTFGTTVFIAQPGLSSAFPWLSSIANSYEEYEFTKLTYVYSNIAATSERGRVTIGFDPDVLDDDPVNKVELFQYAQCAEGSVWSEVKLDVKCPPRKYTRMGPIPNSDLKTYDAGALVVGVSNTATTNVMGELFVEYTVKLHTPQPSKCPGYRASKTGVSLTGSWFGTGNGTWTYVDGNLNIWTIDDHLVFGNTGDYLIAVKVTDSVTAPGALGLTGTTTVTVLYSFGSDSATSTTGSTNYFMIRVTEQAQVAQLVSAGSATSGDTFVTVAMCNL